MDWDYELLRSDKAERTKKKDHVLNLISEMSSEGKDLVDTLKEDYRLVGFIPNVVFIKVCGTESELKASWVTTFNSEALLFKHKTLPVLAVVGAELNEDHAFMEKVSQKEWQEFCDENRVVTALTWIKQLITSPKSTREKSLDLALDSIKCFDQGEPRDAGKLLIKSLHEQFDIFGFIPSVMYIMEKGTTNDMKAQWVHPFSTPTVLCKHKRLPMYYCSNGNLDLNDSRLRKIAKNNSMESTLNIRGITG